MAARLHQKLKESSLYFVLTALLAKLIGPRIQLVWKLGYSKNPNLLGAYCQLKRVLLNIGVLLNRGFLYNCCSLRSPSVDHQHRVFSILLVFPMVPVAVVEQMEPAKNNKHHSVPKSCLFSAL